MSVSVRVSIAWAPLYEPVEETSTLVLTGHRYFIDQRVFLPLPAPSDDATTTSKVDWAFAGTREAGTPDEEGWTRCIWTHTIDSRSLSPPADSGLLRSIPGDPALAEEKGEMLNPATGKVTRHKEVWRDLEVPKGTEIRFWECEGGKGMVGRVGDDALGVSRDDEREGGVWTWRARRREERWTVVFEEPRGAASSGNSGFDLLASEPSSAEAWRSPTSEVWTVREAWTTS